MVVPFNGKKYSVALSRSDVESYFNINLIHLGQDLDLWRSAFIERYAYNKHERQRFSELYVKVAD